MAEVCFICGIMGYDNLGLRGLTLASEVINKTVSAVRFYSLCLHGLCLAGCQGMR